MAMTIEQVIGENVARLRQQRDWNQRQLGEALELATGKRWERQAVWAAERGKRAWAAADLIGLAEVFDVAIGELMATPDAVLVGSVTTTAETLRRRTEGAGQLAAHWAQYLALVSLANVLRQVENEWLDTAKEVRQEVARNPELRVQVESRLARYYATAVNDARAMAERDDVDVSTPVKLAKYMEEWGYNQLPEIRAAKCVLRGTK